MSNWSIILRLTRSRTVHGILTGAFCLGVVGVSDGSALAAGAAPGWEVTASSLPTVLAPGGQGRIEIDVYNVGEAHSTGPVTVTDTLPEGVVAEAAGYDEARLSPLWDCTGIGTSVVTCTNDPKNLPSIPYHSEFSTSDKHSNGSRAQLAIEVSVGTGVLGTLPNQVSVSGGGALAAASVTDPIAFGSSPASTFGLQDFDGWFTGLDGTTDTQAGSHPYEVTFSFHLNTREIANPGRPTEDILQSVGGHLRHVEVELPPGLVGNPTAVPRCPRYLFEAGQNPDCPVSTMIGLDFTVVTAAWEESPGGFLPKPALIPVYNLEPPKGVPAQFGFYVAGVPTFLDAGVRSGGDYGITEHVDNISQKAEPLDNVITLWGEPADPSHDFERYVSSGSCVLGCAGGGERKPFLTLPTSCGAPGRYGMSASTWETVGEGSAEFLYRDSAHSPVGLSGCDHLGFSPSISVAPDTSVADTPAGLTVEVGMPQEGLVQPEGLATSNIMDTTVVLPKGVTINPGQAAGLGTCGAGEDALTTETEKTEGRENTSAPSCPNSSRVGTVQITTPLLSDKLEGSVYVMPSDPPNLRLLLAASGDGVNLKLVGNVHLDEQTGQITTTFSETPELPFSDLKLSFSGGAQAALSTPTECGVYTTTADFTPWSTPAVKDALLQNGFAIEHGTGDGPCPPTPLAFDPSMDAGSTTDQAGGYTDFSMLLTRPDDQQRISTLQFKAPEGLLGMISQIPLCPEPHAQAGTCGSASQIGHATVEAGPGSYPLVIPENGHPPDPIYLTGPYKGAPYGLSIVTRLVVGPFDLGTIITRAKIEVDPLTAQITVTTDPLPQTVDGVPSDLRTIDAVVDRPGFMFNPTDCSPMSFSGIATSIEGATAPLSSHFQMGSCRSLTFKPNFKVSVTGKNNRKNGAGLTASILYPTGPLGDNQASSQSNVAYVKVDLPKQLPSRLPTLQKACPAHVFEANPANCPSASIVGHATAITPVLPVPVTGPAYFVSYGGAKFPELVIVLQGYGVTVYLHGETFINEKTGITSSTFHQVPDVPITSFQLTLPQGPYSALAANTDLCKLKKLAMPTLFTGHNGLTIKQNTPIALTGCPKTAAHKNKPTHPKKKKGRKKG